MEYHKLMLAQGEGSLKPDTTPFQWHYWLLGLAVVLSLVWVGNLVIRDMTQVQAGSSDNSLSQLREQLLADATSLRGSWSRTLNPLVQEVQGDLVWNATQQQGVMRFVRLPQLADGAFYQLWLYDSRSSDGKPIAGTVLQQSPTLAEWFAPIQHEEKVLEPYKFELVLVTGKPNDEPQLLLMVQP